MEINYNQLIKKIKFRNVGLIGFGSIGKRHYKNLKEIFSSIIIYDPKYHNKKKLEEIYNFCDDIFICSPLDSHENYLKKSMQLKKNIFIEKPLLLNTKKFYKPIINYYKNKKVIYVGFNLRFRKIVKFIKDEIDKNNFGKIYWAKFLMSSYLPNWRNNYNIHKSYANSKINGGVLLDSIHELDLAEFFFGNSKLKSYYLDNLNILKIKSDEYANLTLKHNNGVISNIQLDYLNKNNKREITICGSKNYLEADIVKGELKIIGKKRIKKKINYNRNDEYKNELINFYKLISLNKKNLNLKSNLNIHSIANQIKRGLKS
tara:strand:+ start:3139 stop:4089 length:951 start_codon:yes stop_codon:yes gene_type:complete